MCEFPLAKLGLEAVSLLAFIILTKDFLKSGHDKSDDHVSQEDLCKDCQAEAQYIPQSRSDQHEQADENNQAQNVGNGFHDYSLMARIVSVLGHSQCGQLNYAQSLLSRVCNATMFRF